MDRSTTRNKCEARRIESWLLNQMAVRGVTNIAKALGMDKSSITRWKETMVPKMALLLAELEYGVVDEDVARVSKQVALHLEEQIFGYLKNEKPQTSGNSFEA
ncbi:CII family transcriptional regulator [Enterobacter kobei]|uniref:CII family transcriptional regulator n=1 Tax=Enterobacter kobei TaxID=208224 RepID=UPI0028D5DA98|nr:CII family transcriptional regulator [Enterobacter kobei]WNP33613.1 CII family transcriptional regulator [Enterobacter kobei]WNP36218.1 CII family transcriptional regulator [Enterobacter kobei]